MQWNHNRVISPPSTLNNWIYDFKQIYFLLLLHYVQLCCSELKKNQNNVLIGMIMIKDSWYSKLWALGQTMGPGKGLCISCEGYPSNSMHMHFQHTSSIHTHTFNKLLLVQHAAKYHKKSLHGTNHANASSNIFQRGSTIYFKVLQQSI